MKKILLLGGSNCQKNALIHGKAQGYEIILADYSPSPAAAQYADAHVLVSTFDGPGCTEAAKAYQVQGVMTMGTDQPVLTAAQVADALNLPSFLSEEEAKAVTNKKIMKTLFKENDIPTVPFTFVRQGMDFSSLSDDFPAFSDHLVLKPLDSQGQRGVYRLSSAEEIPQYLPQTLSFSREKEALLEAFYPSDEITISGWIDQSQLSILTITDRILLEDPVHIGICSAHRFPSLHMDRYEEIEEICQQIVSAFAIKNGPLYVQMLVGHKGIMVNEVAARIGGAFEDVIIPKISGFPILDAVMKGCLGAPVETCMLAHYDCRAVPFHASVQLMFANPGEIASITPLEELKGWPAVLDAGYNYKAGETIPPIANATARFGHCVFWGSQKEVADALLHFKKHFQILNQKGNNLYKVLT